MSFSNAPTLNKAVHIRYWLRCLKIHLPTQYTSNDSQRATLAFFTLSALDLLGVLHERTTADERAAYVKWIYRCQHPDGGFRGFTGADAGQSRESCWDPANMAATYFSLASLLVLGDDMKQVKRKECLKWIRRLQLEDGSFGEAIGKGGKVEGGRDARYCYCAVAVRWILQAGEAGEQNHEDINVGALIRFITSSQVGLETWRKKMPLIWIVLRWGNCERPIPRGLWYALNHFCRRMIVYAHVDMQLDGHIVVLVHCRFYRGCLHLITTMNQTLTNPR